MTQDHHARTGLSGGAGQQPMPCAPRGGRETGSGLVAGPQQRASVRAQSARLGERIGGPSPAVDLKLVIHHQGQDRASSRPRPIQDRSEQEQGVPAPRKADGERSARGGIKPPIEGGPDLI